MNYKKREKFLGVVEYKNLFVILGIGVLIFEILKCFQIETGVKVAIFVMLLFFCSLIILIGINGENMLDFLYFALKFYTKAKVYLYRKTAKEEGEIYEKISKIMDAYKKH